MIKNKLKIFFSIISMLSLCLIFSMLIKTSITSKANDSDLKTNNDHSVSTDNSSTTNEQSDETLTSPDFSMLDLKNRLNTSTLVELKSVDKLREYIDEYNASNAIPTSCDNSTSQYFPPVGNQGNVGSCNSWAAIYYQMTYSVNKKLDRPSNSNDNIMSPTFMYTLTNKGLDNGSSYIDVLKILTDIGCVSKKLVPIVSVSNEEKLRTVHANNKDIYMEASKYRVKEYYTIGTANNSNPGRTKYTNEDINAIKKALSMGEILTITTYPNRWNEKKLDSSLNGLYKNELIITKVSGKDTGSHRMAIVGYDDNICVDINENGTIEDAEKGAFKLVNSWSSTWGNKGYIWISYDAIKLNSEADTKELQNKERTTGFFNIVGYTVDVNNSNNNIYLMLDVETVDLQSLELVITATDPNNKKYIYEPAPFSNAMYYGSVGPFPFSSKKDGNKGQIYVDLTKLDPNITKDNIDKYNWSFQLNDSSLEHYVFIKDMKFYFKSDDTYSDSISKSPITLFNFSRYITITNNIWNLLF